MIKTLLQEWHSFNLVDIDSGRQLALPDVTCCLFRCGARRRRRNDIYPRPPSVTSRQRLPSFQEWAANLYMHSVRVRSLPRILALLGCGVGIATLWRDVLAVDSSRVPDPQVALPRWPGWTRLGCPSVLPTARWLWFWDQRVHHGWTCG